MTVTVVWLKPYSRTNRNFLAYLGRYTTDDKNPHNYWVPTSLIMDNLFFAYQAIDDHNETLFSHYIETIKDMIKDSESALFEVKNRAVPHRQPYHDKVFQALNL